MIQTVDNLSNILKNVIGINLEEWEIENLLSEYKSRDLIDNLTEEEELNIIVNIGKETDLIYGLRWYEDCVTIRNSFLKRGVDITLRAAERIWDYYSEEYYCAGWISVPGVIGDKTYDTLYGIALSLGILRDHNSEEIKEILDDYLNNGLSFELVNGDKIGVKYNNELITEIELKNNK